MESNTAFEEGYARRAVAKLRAKLASDIELSVSCKDYARAESVAKILAILLASEPE